MKKLVAVLLALSAFAFKQPVRAQVGNQSSAELSFSVGLTSQGHAEYKLASIPFRQQDVTKPDAEFSIRYTPNVWAFGGAISIPLTYNLSLAPGIETGTLHEEYFVGLAASLRYELLHGLSVKASGGHQWVPTKSGEWGVGVVALGYALQL